MQKVYDLSNEIVIPFDNYAWFQESVIINNVMYNFDFKWNTRGSFWTMSIYDAAYNVIIYGIKLVMNYELLDQYPYDTIPSGTLFCVDGNFSFQTIGPDDLGVRVSLCYVPTLLEVNNVTV